MLLADSHPVYREELVRALVGRPDFQLEGVAEDGWTALALIRDQRPEVALISEDLSRLGGNRIAQLVQQEDLGTRVVLLAAAAVPVDIYNAVAFGVGAYLSKTCTRREICDTIAKVARGATILAPDALTGLAAAVRGRETDDTDTPLSPRELEVLTLTAEGLNAHEIARRLGVSSSTVKSHLGSLYEKLEVSDRAAAVAAAMRRDLLA